MSPEVEMRTSTWDWKATTPGLLGALTHSAVLPCLAAKLQRPSPETAVTVADAALKFGGGQVSGGLWGVLVVLGDP